MQLHNKYRHMVAKMKLDQMQAKLAHVCNIIKERNPSLIQYICQEVQLKRPYGV